MIADKTPETVDAQLADLERQGGGMAHLAHISAGLLLVAFSAGSLVSISHAAFMTFLAAWNAGQADIPDGISLVVNLLLVLAADVALLYAASVLRVLTAARAPKEERRVHVWAMVGASALESSTYRYLAWQFDRPTTFFLWSLVIARALGAPLFAAYLSMARPLPVAPRDVAYQAALASGKGVVRDVATLSADPHAPLHRKVKIYTAASLMTHGDRARFDDIISAVSEPQQHALQGAGMASNAQMSVATPRQFAPADEALSHAPEAQQGAALARADTLDMPTPPPTGPGSPTVAPVAPPRRRAARPAVLRLPAARPAATRRRVAARASAKGVRTPQRSGVSLEAEARAAWASGARTINAMRDATGMSRNAAGGWVRTLKAEGVGGASTAAQEGGQYAQ